MNSSPKKQKNIQIENISSKKLQDYKQSKPEELQLFELIKENEKQYSNSIEFYDAIPKYYWGNQKRDKKGRLDIDVLQRRFIHKGIEYKVTIQPAIIEEKTGIFKTYFPSQREELVEDALRKLACEGNGLFLNNEASVVFTLYELQKELKKMGHGYNLSQIKQAIIACASSIINVQSTDGKSIVIMPFFETIGLQTKEDWQGYHQKTKAFIRFNTLVTKSIIQKTFRLYNYDKSMSYKKTLSRWLHKRMSHNYRQASSDNSYHIMLSTIIRDSGTKEQKQLRGNLRDIKIALEEMINKKAIESYKIINILDGKKIIDAKFSLIPHQTFIFEAKYANKIQKNLNYCEEQIKTRQIIEEIRKKLT